MESRNFTSITNLTRVIASNHATYKTTITVWYCMSAYLILTGCFLNSLLLLVILSKKTLRTGAGLLIAHVVFLDWTLSTIYFPINLSQTRSGPPSTWLSCSLGQTAIATLLGAKYYSILFLAVNRFHALTAPIRYRFWEKVQINTGLIGLAWLTALATCLPENLLGLGGTWNGGPPWGSCVFTDDGTANYRNLAFCYTYVPTGVSVSIYLILAVREMLSECRRRCRGRVACCLGMGPVAIIQLQRRRSWARILVVMTALEALCIFVPSIFLVRRRWILAWPPLGLWVRTIGQCGLVVNPLIFFALNTDYQHQLMVILTGFTAKCRQSYGQRLRGPTVNAGHFDLAVCHG